MYESCPKCGSAVSNADSTNADKCPHCGIIFAKWLKQQLQTDCDAYTEDTSSVRPGIGRQIVSRLLDPGPRSDNFSIYLRLAIFVFFFIWGWQFILMDFTKDPFEIGRSFMHVINLVFHEAGHVLFQPFGRFMTIAGGSLFQLIVPLVVMLVFILQQQDNFAASVALWWLGQSFMDLAPYIDDALVQQLVLLGGRTGADAPGNHDWNNILIEFNRLEKSREYATIADSTGTILMLIAFGWGACILYRQFLISRG